MLNHVRTLLLNENSSSVSSWYVDSSYVPLVLKGQLASFRDLLFYGADTRVDAEKRVSQVMPFVLDPEFSDVRGLFDWRVTVGSDDPERAIRRGTVFSFYYRISDEQVDVAKRCVNSVGIPQLFVWNDSLRDGPTVAMRRMRAVYQDSKELCKRFSACLWAYVLRLESMRVKSKPMV